MRLFFNIILYIMFISENALNKYRELSQNRNRPRGYFYVLTEER